MVAQTLTHTDLRRLAPSIFAATPWHGMSARYRQVPTIEVIDLLGEQGFRPVKATQGRTRLPGKGDFTKHMIRMRHADYLTPMSVGAELPELVLTNSHDGTAAYRFNSGIFRLVCSNGLVVALADFGGISVRHSGGQDFRQRVIDATFQIVNDTPKVMASIEAWKGIPLTRPQQIAFATAALEVRDGGSKIEPTEIIAPRRSEDAAGPDGTRDLWRTLNTAQEALLKGGLQGRSQSGRRTKTRPNSGVDADIRTNRGLWRLAEEMARIIGA